MEKQTEDKLKILKQEFDEIEASLIDPLVLKDLKQVTNLSKKRKKIFAKVKIYHRYLELMKEIDEAKQIIKNEKDKLLIAELKTMIINWKKDLILVEEQIVEAMIEIDPLDQNDVIVEIQSAAGGDEAKIFVGDLYRMYLRYAAKMDWKLDLIQVDEADMGGYSFISFEIEGTRVYGNLKFESGVHRVQRVPSTESLGRVHTSTATVVVLPQIEDNDEVEVSNSDLRIDTYRASGAGGQHINKTDSAVRITHIPTGIVGQSQDGRSQHDNKDKAMKQLLSRLYEVKMNEQKNEKKNFKSSAVGTGDRSEKIRTYNYPQNRITDHRINLTLKKLDRIMDGSLNEIIDALIATAKE
ncbi:MAG: peptide chain release factor 1 [Mycoplasmataceae bacterium]|nr:peptide chain release factor 1 [Mycoplasmataceae bacterium]